MLEISRTSEQVLDIRVAGMVTSEEVREIGKEIEDRLARHEKLGVVADITDLQDMTADAIAEDMKLELTVLDRLQRFPRMAVISDKQWVAAVMNLVARLLPTIEMRVFHPDNVAEARAFAENLSGASRASTVSAS